MAHSTQDRLISRKKNSRIAMVLMILMIIVFGIVYMQVVETVRMINRDNAINKSASVERVTVESSGDSVNLNESR